MRISTAGRSNRDGFTLIELAVVVLLLALFGAFTLPLASRIGRDDGTVTARRIAATVKYLFNEAALSGLEHRLIFDHDRGRFAVTRIEVDGALVELVRPSARLALPEGIAVKDIAFRERGALATGVTVIRFFPAGYLEESLIHFSASGRIVTLILHPLTGITEVAEGYHAF